MVDRVLYKREFEPIVQPGEFLMTFPAKEYYVVGMIYPLPLLSVDLCDSSHLNASLTTSESSETEVNDIYLDDDELAQLRMIPVDDFVVTYVAKPKASPYYTTRKKTWDLQTILDDPRSNPAIEHLNLNEIFQFEDTEMYVKAKANTSTLTQARLAFFGFRLIIDKITQEETKGKHVTPIPTEGFPRARAAAKR